MSSGKDVNECSGALHCSTAIDEPEDCAFQFFTGGQSVVDTGLITRTAANALWAEHKPKFVAAVENGEEAKVALWVHMFNDTNYQRSAFRIRSDECVIERGFCFVKRPLP